MSLTVDSACRSRTSSATPHRRTRQKPLIAIPTKYRNRPTRLRACLYRVWEIAEELQLTRGDVAVLQAILATGLVVDKPYDPIFPRKTTIARMADVSDATVYRALSHLECIGLIRRSVQTRLDDGTLNMTTIVITKKLADLLNLTTQKSNKTKCGCEPNEQVSDRRVPSDSSQRTKYSENRDISPSSNKCSQESKTEHRLEHHTGKIARGSTPAYQTCKRGESIAGRMLTTTTDQVIDGLRDGSIYKEHTDERKPSVNNQSTRPNVIRIDGRRVPLELFWLVEQKRLSYGQLFKLMKLAKTVPGQTLSDYVAYRSERIKQLSTEQDCFRYIRSLIDDEIDARYLCAQRSKQEHRSMRHQQREAAKATRQSWSNAHDGKTFLNPETEKLYRVNARYGLLEVGRRDMTTALNDTVAISSKFMNAVDQGRLVPYVVELPVISRETARQRLSDMATKLHWVRLKTCITKTQNYGKV